MMGVCNRNTNVRAGRIKIDEKKEPRSRKLSHCLSNAEVLFFFVQDLPDENSQRP